MKHIQIRRSTQKQLGTLGILSLAALSQFGIASQAQAAWSDDSYRDDNYIQVKNGNGNRQSVVLQGRVEDERRGNDAFVLRATNGRTYIVDTSNTSQPNLDRGDIVEVRGRLNGGTIVANSVVITNNNGSGYNGNGSDRHGDGYIGTLSGHVQNDRRGNSDSFTFRADDGRTYRVDTRYINEPNLSQGDPIEVVGRINGNSIIAQNVRILNGIGNSSGDSNTVMTGRVTRDYSGRDFEMRTDSGRSVTVRTRREPIRLSSGDRVQVNGNMRNGIFQADTVRILNNDDVNGYGSRVDFTGVVQRDNNGQRFTVRASNGRTYVVQNSNTSVDSGDRVRVVGYLNNGVVRAERVTITNDFNGNNGSNNTGSYGRTVRLEGTVRQVGNGYLVVRDNDDNQDRTVRTNDANDFERGDDVIVTGRLRGNEIIASGIRRN